MLLLESLPPAIECEPLQAISNGMISYSTSGSPNYELGTVATYSCNPGYSLNLDNGGSETRTCVDDGDGDAEGIFNGRAPSCICKFYDKFDTLLHTFMHM